MAVEADDGKAAANKIPDELGAVIAVNLRPGQPQQGQVVMGNTGTQFQRTQTVTTPAANG